MSQYPRPTRSTPLGPSSRSAHRSIPPPVPSPSHSTDDHSRLEMEQDLKEKEQQLAECTSAIQRNVLTRQISLLRDKLVNLNTTLGDTSWHKEKSPQRSTTTSQLLQPPASSSLLPLPPAPLTGSIPTQRRSKTPNTDRRNTDIEFATEIGQGLLIEVRKMQTIIQEKEEQIRELEIQKTDLERSAETMAKQLRQREETEEHLKEGTWNLELTKQELTLGVTELQHQLDKSSHEQAKLNQQLDIVLQDMDQLRDKEEKLTESLEQSKQRHEQDMNSMRRQCAGYQRQVQQHVKQIEALTSELAIAKAQSRLSKPLVPTHHQQQQQPTTDDDDTPDPTNTSQHHHYHHHLTNNNTSAMEVESLKTSLAHAHRMVSHLRSHLHKEKTEKFEFKKLLAESQETIEQLQNDPHLWVDASSSSSSSGNPLDDQQKKQRKVKSHRRPATKKPIRGVKSRTRQTNDEVVDSDVSDGVSSDNDEDVPTGFTCLSHELLHAHNGSDTQLHQGAWTVEYSVCLDQQAPVTLCETTSQTDHDIFKVCHQEIQCDLLKQDNEAGIRALGISEAAVNQGVQCVTLQQVNSGPTHQTVDTAVQNERPPMVDGQTQYERSPMIDQQTQYEYERMVDQGTRYDHDWLGSLNNGTTIKHYTQEEMDQVVSQAVEESMAKYKTQLGIKAGEDDQEMILVPARPHHPPPSTLLVKARSIMTTEYPESISSSSSTSTIGNKIHDQQSITADSTITSITQTMIGEWLTKYPRRHMGGQGFSDRRQHLRYFWIHPYTHTLYWSDQAPSHANEWKAKSALVEHVTVGYDDQVPFILVHTSLRQLKIKAPTKERHDIWVKSLNYLVTSGLTSFSPTLDLAITPRRSVSASILRKPSFQRISDMFHRSPSIHDDDEEEDGLENVRLCCGGKHDIGRLEKQEHYHRPAYHQRKHSPLS
ncbi:meiotic cell cortex C-terminal pleckstrin homology-domain-containing protein [Chlamydoabsidia padenii]|nr:meiotic cell cortex C-terminal pleckstrin homology-domain-containing protein [Chlamydoabsidia padenii]